MKKIAIYIVLTLILIQFVGIDKNVPKIENHLDFISLELPPKNIIRLLKNSCYDCHSYETKYPNYSKIAPFSWIIQNHIKQGRERLNFSIWGNYEKEIKKDLLNKSYKQIGARKMPLSSYLLFHKEARAEIKEIEQLYKWFKNKTKYENI